MGSTLPLNVPSFFICAEAWGSFIPQDERCHKREEKHTSRPDQRAEFLHDLVPPFIHRGSKTPASASTFYNVRPAPRVAKIKQTV